MADLLTRTASTPEAYREVTARFVSAELGLLEVELKAIKQAHASLEDTRAYDRLLHLAHDPMEGACTIIQALEGFAARLDESTELYEKLSDILDFGAMLKDTRRAADELLELLPRFITEVSDAVAEFGKAVFKPGVFVRQEGEV